MENLSSRRGDRKRYPTESIRVPPDSKSVLMARSAKNSNRIVVRDVEYRWRANGNDGYIPVTFWPANNIGPTVTCSFGYHETMVPHGEHCRISIGDQLIVTNRLVRRVIEHALDVENYDPLVQGKQLDIRWIEDKIEWSDAVRATDRG